jgi:choline dehydrogenase-like flavoprotein
MFNIVAKQPGIVKLRDANAGRHGLFIIPASIDPVLFERSYARTGHFDNITRPNYELITQHKVNKVIFNGTRAVGVQYIPVGGANNTAMVKASREVILAAGTLHTPQILQLSGIGPKTLLDQAKIPVVVDLPGVGQKYQDQGWTGSVTFKCEWQS